MDKQKLHELRVFATEIRLETLKVIASRGFGHRTKKLFFGGNSYVHG